MRNLLLAMIVVVLCIAALFVKTANAQLEQMPRIQVHHFMPYVLAHPIAQGEGPTIPPPTVQP